MMRTRYRRNCCSLALSIGLLVVATVGHAAQTTRLSVDSAGEEGNGASYDPSISADGRFVAFASRASNLVPGNANRDVFVRDRQTGETARVSVDSTGVQGDGWSYDPAISANGRFVAFSSEATNLVPGDTNGFTDIYVHDRNTGITSRVSIDSAGGEGNDESHAPSISASGQHVVFASSASNLVLGDTNGLPDIFVHDRSTGVTTRVSVDSAGAEGDSTSYDPSISGDGRYVAFGSDASNLELGDTNGTQDIFVHDRYTGSTTRVSVDSTGGEGNNVSSSPSISDSGRYVAFNSDASNLVSGDTNAVQDVFLRDRNTGVTSRVSVDSTGAEGNDGSTAPSISADGRYVAFVSDAANFTPGDTVGSTDVFVRDRNAATTARVSVSTGGGQANERSYGPSVSADGRYVSFGSYASNLVPLDTNGQYDVFVRDRLLFKAISADLEVAVTSEPVSVAKGAFASYTFTVTNNGPAGAGNVALIDISSRAPMTLTASQGFCNKSMTSVCRLGTLASGASATVNVVIKATSRKPLTQQVAVSASPVESVPPNNDVTVSTPVTP